MNLWSNLHKIKLKLKLKKKLWSTYRVCVWCAKNPEAKNWVMIIYIYIYIYIINKDQTKKKKT